MKLDKNKSNYFRTTNKKPILAYYNEYKKDWAIGIQGTSVWYVTETRGEAKKIIRKLINLEKDY